MHAALFGALLVEPPQCAPAAVFNFIADASGASVPPPGQRASSPLRKHKRKAAVPHRSALDGVAAEPPPAPESEDEVTESRPKASRGSSSPDPVAQRISRVPRPPRAASQHPPAPAPELLAAAFDMPLLPPPPFLAAAAAAPVGAPKICAQCGTTTTPMWRTVNGATYCNADGLRLKRKLGLL